ncbi:unnamed protein product [Calypogeia fissa]
MAEKGPHSSEFDEVLITLQDPLECRRVHAAMNGGSDLALSFRCTRRFMPQTEGKEMQFFKYLQVVELEQGLQRPIRDSQAQAVGAGTSECRPPPPPPAPPLPRFSQSTDDWLQGIETQALVSGSTPIRSKVQVPASNKRSKRNRARRSIRYEPPTAAVEQQRRKKPRQESDGDEDPSDESRGHRHKRRRRRSPSAKSESDQERGERRRGRRRESRRPSREDRRRSSEHRRRHRRGKEQTSRRLERRRGRQGPTPITGPLPKLKLDRRTKLPLPVEEAGLTIRV